MRNTTRFVVAATLVFASATAWAGGGIISTFAGGGTSLGDGGPATAAKVEGAMALAADSAGNVYIAQGYSYFSSQLNCRVRKVTPGGVITTVAGNDTSGGSDANNVPATSISICPTGLAVDRAGNLLVSEYTRVRRITPDGNTTVVAGSATAGSSGDGGPATLAKFNAIADVAVDAGGNIYIADGSNRIRRIDPSGVVQSIAGNGNNTSSGDGGPATAAGMTPRAVEVDSAGRVLVLDRNNFTLRRITNGTIARIAGGGTALGVFRSDPVARNAHLYYPTGIALDARGAIYLSNQQNMAHVISPTGIIKVIAGPYIDTTFAYGAPDGFGGDGGPATEALLREPAAITVDPKGNVYIADVGNARVRKITAIDMPPTPAGLDMFAPSEMRLVGSYTVSVAIGDINGDRRGDAVLSTGSWGSDYVEPDNDYKFNVFLQRPDGTLAAPVKFATSGSVNAMIVVDMNRDGYGDLVSGSQFGITIRPGGPAGLGAAISWPGIQNAERASSLTATDMDLDGNIDIVAMMEGSSAGGSSPSDLYGLTIFHGNGHFGVSRKRFIAVKDVGGKPVIADINRDGRADLVMTWWKPDNTNSGLAVFLHDGVDAFRAPMAIGTGTTGYGGGLALGDFDSNGLWDLVLSKGGNAPYAEQAHFRQTSAGELVFVRSWGTFDGTAAAAGADINGDGRDDLLTLHDGWSSIGYREQINLADGSSWLETELKYHYNTSSNTSSYSLAVGDLNGDGCLDVATAERNYGLQVLRARRCFVVAHGASSLLPPFVGATASTSSATTQPVVASQPAATPQPVAASQAFAWFGARRASLVALSAVLALSFGIGGWLVWRRIVPVVWVARHGYWRALYRWLR